MPRADDDIIFQSLVTDCCTLESETERSKASSMTPVGI
jgi:hypothetical protein